MNTNTAPVRGKTGLTVFVVLVVIAALVAVSLGLEAVGLPMWPLTFFLFYFYTISGAEPKKLWTDALGGLLGILGGFASPLLIEWTGYELLGLAALLVSLCLLLTLSITKRFPFVNSLTMLMITLTTSLHIPAGAWAGLRPGNPAVADMSLSAALPGVLISYALSVLLCCALSMAIGRFRSGGAAPRAHARTARRANE